MEDKNELRVEVEVGVEDVDGHVCVDNLAEMAFEFLNDEDGSM